MNKSILATAGTYFGRWLFLLPLVFLVPWVWIGILQGNWSVRFLLSYAAMCGTCCGLHLKEHLARPQGILIPRYKVIHLLVAAALAGLALVPVTLLAATMAGEHMGTVLALIGSMFVGVATISYYVAGLGLVFAAFLPLLASVNELRFLEWNANREAYWLGGLILAGLGFLANRILRLHEESLEYRWRPIVNVWDLRAAQNWALSSQPRALDSWPVFELLSRLAARPLDRLHGYAGAGFWSRMRLFYRGFGFDQFKWFIALGMLVPLGLYLSLGLLISAITVLKWGAFIYLFCPYLLLGTWHRDGGHWLGPSLLRPITRPQWARQVLFAIVWSMFSCWVTVAVEVVALALFASNPLRWMQFLQILALFGSFGYVALGLMCWLGVRPRPNRLVLLFVGSQSPCLFLLSPLMWTDYQSALTPGTFAGINFVFLLSGLFLLCRFQNHPELFSYESVMNSTIV